MGCCPVAGREKDGRFHHQVELRPWASDGRVSCAPSGAVEGQGSGFERARSATPCACGGHCKGQTLNCLPAGRFVATIVGAAFGVDADSVIPASQQETSGRPRRQNGVAQARPVQPVLFATGRFVLVGRCGRTASAVTGFCSEKCHGDRRDRRLTKPKDSSREISLSGPGVVAAVRCRQHRAALSRPVLCLVLCLVFRLVPCLVSCLVSCPVSLPHEAGPTDCGRKGQGLFAAARRRILPVEVPGAPAPGAFDEPGPCRQWKTGGFRFSQRRFSESVAVDNRSS